MPAKTTTRKATTKRPTKKPAKSSRFLSRFSSQKLTAIAFIVMFAGIGSYMLFTSHAATMPLLTTEAETMTLPTSATIIADTTASAEQAIQFIGNGTATTILNLPSAATGFTISAKGTQCKGSPTMVTKIDGVQVGSTTVNATSWTGYPYTKALTAGSHSLSLSFTNYSTWKNCAKRLFVDKVVVSGDIPTVPVQCANGLDDDTDGKVDYPADPGCSSASDTTEAPDPVTSSSQIYWGARIDGDVYDTTDAPWNLTTWDTFEQHTGKKVSIEHFGQDAPWDGTAFAATPYDIVTSRGAIPMVSVRSKYAKLTDIATVNGQHDAAVKTWATDVKNWGKPFLMRFDWEMNGTWDLGGDWGKQAAANPQSYVNAWRHFHDLVVAQGAINVTWVWCPNAEFPGSTPLSSLYPGDAYVDWTCIDGYNWGTNPNKSEAWKSFDTVMRQTYNSLLTIAPSKPIIIGETASTEYGGSKASWITDALTTQLPNNFKQIKALVWFNWNVQQGAGRMDWPVESSAASQAAFAQGIASPYYAPNNYGNMPSLTKVQPLP